MGEGGESVTRVRCSWSTWQRQPYFANLKAMRMVLDALRGCLDREGGRVVAYVFLDDRIVFVAEGREGSVRVALESAWVETKLTFSRSDRKALWGERSDEAVESLEREEILRPLRRLPAEAGLACDAGEYPWAGGDWLFPGH